MSTCSSSRFLRAWLRSAGHASKMGWSEVPMTFALAPTMTFVAVVDSCILVKFAPSGHVPKIPKTGYPQRNLL